MEKNVLENSFHKVESVSKTIENISSLIEDLRKESYQVAAYEYALIQFVYSARNLMLQWEILPQTIEPEITEHTRYPFQMSFDELVYEMEIWLQATQSRIKLWKEGKLND